MAIDNCYIRISEGPAEEACILAAHLAVDLDQGGNVVDWDVYDASENEALIDFCSAPGRRVRWWSCWSRERRGWLPEAAF